MVKAQTEPQDDANILNKPKADMGFPVVFVMGQLEFVKYLLRGAPKLSSFIRATVKSKIRPKSYGKEKGASSCGTAVAQWPCLTKIMGGPEYFNFWTNFGTFSYSDPLTALLVAAFPILLSSERCNYNF